MKQESPSGDDSTAVVRGRCFLTLAYDIGLAIVLDSAERHIRERVERPQLADERRQPSYFGYNPRPVRFLRKAESFPVHGYSTQPDVEVTLWDFGAAALTFRVDIASGTPLAEVAVMTSKFDETDLFEVRGGQIIAELLAELGPAVIAPALRESLEDYQIIELQELSDPGLSASAVLGAEARNIARLVRAERPRLSAGLVEETMRYRLSYRERDDSIDEADSVVIGWNAALFYGQADEASVEDLRAVLQFALVQLLEMRLLDEQLDRALDEAYEIVRRRRRSLRADLQRVSQIQVDAAMAFEGVHNALTLIGDEFLTDVYDLAVSRFRLLDHERSVKRKLTTLSDIYSKIADRQAQRRSELLELTVIALIVIEVLLSAIPYR